MKQIQEIVAIIQKYDLGGPHAPECAPDIPTATLQNVAKNVDLCAILTKMVAVLDTTRRGKSCKSGLAFTLAGFYITRLDVFLETGDCPDGKAMKKPFYVKYADISEVSVSSRGVQVRLADGRSISIRSADISNKQSLVDLLRELAAYDKTWDSGGFAMQTGLVEKKELPANVKKKCHAIIHGASVLAAGCGAAGAQLPCADAVPITTLQILMIISLASVFGFEISWEVAGAVGNSFIAMLIGRGISQRLVGWIPGLGNVINAATACGITESMGWFVAHGYYRLELANQAKYALEGEKRGYLFASAELEAKLRAQAALFLKEKENVEKLKEHYDQLLDDYEAYIAKLEGHQDLTDGDKKALDKVKGQYDELKALQDPPESQA